ncbi:MAG: phosphatase PAP2 family protein [Thiotrichales bacterium]
MHSPNTAKSSLTPRLRRVLIILATLLVYSAVSEWLSLDLKIAELFFNPDQSADRWFGAESPLVSLLYHSVPIVVGAGLLGSLIVLTFCARKGCRCEFRSTAVLLSLTLLLGAGLIVNSLLKEHWGRPRPVQTLEFGGVQPYQPPVLISAGSGRSFPSGHVAASFSLLALLPFFSGSSRKRRLLALLIVSYGSAVAFARVAAGGHYFTDVLWGAAIAWAVVTLLVGMLRPCSLQPEVEPNPKAFRVYSTLFSLLLALLIYRVMFYR